MLFSFVAGILTRSVNCFDCYCKLTFILTKVRADLEIECVYAVSYTHLDVSKRQVLYGQTSLNNLLSGILFRRAVHLCLFSAVIYWRLDMYNYLRISSLWSLSSLAAKNRIMYSNEVTFPLEPKFQKLIAGHGHQNFRCDVLSSICFKAFVGLFGAYDFILVRSGPYYYLMLLSLPTKVVFLSTFWCCYLNRLFVTLLSGAGIYSMVYLLIICKPHCMRGRPKCSIKNENKCNQKQIASRPISFLMPYTINSYWTTSIVRMTIFLHETKFSYQNFHSGIK